MRQPSSKRERLVAALNSGLDDLYPDGNGRIIITGKNSSGESIYLGEICETLIYRKDANAKMIIDFVKFGVIRVL